MVQIIKPIAVLDWPTKIGDQLQDAIDIKAAIDGGSTGISTVALGAAIVAAQAAETAVGNKAPGSVEARDGAFAVMKAECENIMAKVQLLANALDSDNAKALILSSHFHVKGAGSFDKQNFVAKNGAASGMVDLVAKGNRHPSAHEWGSSVDEGKTWDYVTTTLQASTKSDGYTRGAMMQFRHRIILKDGPTDWDFDDLVIL